MFSFCKQGKFIFYCKFSTILKFVFSIALYDKGEIASDETKPNHLMFAVSSDRGLCGGIHSGMAKAIKAKMETKASGVNPMIVICGDKVRGILQRTHSKLAPLDLRRKSLWLNDFEIVLYDTKWIIQNLFLN